MALASPNILVGIETADACRFLDRLDGLSVDNGRTSIPMSALAFAFGIHYCLGHQLARLEGRTALTTLLQRFPNWELTRPWSHLRYKPTVPLRGLTSLPIRMY